VETAENDDSGVGCGHRNLSFRLEATAAMVFSRLFSAAV
jgi:hypothetical protein